MAARRQLHDICTASNLNDFEANHLALELTVNFGIRVQTTLSMEHKQTNEQRSGLVWMIKERPCCQP